MKLHEWEIKFTDTKVTLKHFLKHYIVPKYEVIIDDSLAFTCVVWLDSSKKIMTFTRYINVQYVKIGLSKLLTHIKSRQIWSQQYRVEFFKHTFIAL